MMRMRSLVLVLGVLCCARVFAADSAVVTRVIALVGAEDYAGAVKVLKPLAEGSPEDSELQYWLGRAYYGEMMYAQAAECFATAVDRDAENRNLCVWHARSLRDAGDMKGALDAYATYHARFPDDNTVLSEYAVTRALTGDYPGARASFSMLAERDHSRKTATFVRQWLKALDALTAAEELEPPKHRQFTHFEIQYSPNDLGLVSLTDSIERARIKVSSALGIMVTGFRVLDFADGARYQRYAQLSVPDTREMTAAAFTLHNLLVLWSPATWTHPPASQDEFDGILRHEITHLAIQQITGGQGVPLWLNEGLACYYGGWAGTRSGQVSDTPLSPSDLEAALVSTDLAVQAQAYAQAHAMVTVFARNAQPGVLRKMLVQLAHDTPLTDAFQQATGETFTDFLATWKDQYAKLARDER